MQSIAEADGLGPSSPEERDSRIKHMTANQMLFPAFFLRSLFYGRARFCCKIMQNYATRCKRHSLGSPMKNMQRNTVQNSEELVRAFRSQMLYPVELRAPEKDS
jgi:hypothetical protein